MIKKLIINLLYKLLELIEKIEYQNLSLDEDNIGKKILSSSNVDIKVKSDKGFVNATQIHTTQPYTVYKLILENGYDLECADNHIVFTFDLREVFVKDLIVGDKIFTDKGESKVVSLTRLKHKISMFDLSIDSSDHRYYTSGILSHNTITSAITILYYCIFENQKNVMIAANKKATTDEIVSKIKDIYYYLPFWIKPGVSNWNQSQITFEDTKCKIRSATATKTAAIGFTIDFLFLDEFAHVASNIADDFYRSIYPTVSSIKNSKIIITSTPNGYNLFWKLLNGAEKPKGDKDKNTYASMRVYWYQVPGRFITYLRLDDYQLDYHKINKEDLFYWINNMGFDLEILDEKGFTLKEGLKLVYNYENSKSEIHIPNKLELIPDDIKAVMDEKEWENPLSDYFRTLYYTVCDDNGVIIKRIRLLDLCDISSWKEDAIKDIGSLEAFNQEYDLQFLSGSKMVLDASTMNKIENSIQPFEYIEFPQIISKTFLSLEKLTWIKNEELFNKEFIKRYNICMSVDIAEGLNGDYSVINIFRVMIKEESTWSNTFLLDDDFYRLEQIGIYHCNRTSVQELGEILYLLSYELFDSDKLCVVIEANNWGNELTKTMRDMYNGRNKYSSHIFCRYKHREDDKKPSIGIKLRTQKNKLVKDYQTRIKRGDVIIHHQGTLHEITKFIKKDTISGYTFQAEGGDTDDIVMSVVEICSVFKQNIFKEMIFRLKNELNRDLIEKMNKITSVNKLNVETSVGATNYSSLFKAKSMANIRHSNMNRNLGTSTGYGGGLY